MATIKEIAALAGVSRGTVDRVLNNRGAGEAHIMIHSSARFCNPPETYQMED